MALAEDFIYQLKQLNPIETVMSSYVNLIRRGHNFVCLCPFHSEKSPSCTVYPETDSFYCFGCGAGGDTITFIRKIENLEYIEAVKLLADHSGIQMPNDAENKGVSQVKARILEANRAAAKYFYTQLLSEKGKKALLYFKNRQLKPETIKKYGLGFAPDDWHDFKTHMNSLDFSDDELILSSLCRKSQNGSVYSIFRNRVMFPIIDLRGNIIAFGGRILEGDGPKYLNSSDTPVFKKSRNLFSMNFAKNSSVNKLILAEGYMDVIAINQAGFENVAATLGTALTPEQARLMAQYAKEVIIAYDSDNAGQAATHRAINLLSEAGLTPRIIKMDGAKDPDEYIKKFGAIRFKLLLDNSDGAIAFELEKCKAELDMESDTGKIEFLKRAVNVIADIRSSVEREVYISRISNTAGIPRETIKINVDSQIKNKKRIEEKKEWNAVASSALIPDKINPESVKYPRESKAEKGIIRYLFINPDKCELICSKIKPDDFVTEFNKKVFRILTEKLENSIDFSLSLLGSEFSVEEMGKITEIIAKNREISITEKEILDFIEVLKEYNSKNIISGEITDEELIALQQKLKAKKF